MNEYYLKNMEGILCDEDTPLFSFKIENRQLVQWEDLGNHHLWPPEMALWGVSYRNINEFFNRRVVRNGAMFIRDYLDALQLDYYDFEEMVKRNNGANRVDSYWVRFPYVGAKCWYDVCHQTEPIIGA